MALRDSLDMLVLDEADLLLSFGYEEDVRRILEQHLPRLFQAMLMSATLTPEVDEMKRLLLRNPVSLPGLVGVG